MYQQRHIRASIGQVQGFRTLQEVKNEAGEALSAVSLGTIAWRPTTTLSRARCHAGNTRATYRCIVDQPSASLVAHKRMTGKYLLDAFGGSGFLAKATHHLCFAWLCARHEVWTQV